MDEAAKVTLQEKILGEFLRTIDARLLADYAVLANGGKSGTTPREDGDATEKGPAQLFDKLTERQRPAVEARVFAEARRYFVLDALNGISAEVVAARWEAYGSRPRRWSRWLQRNNWLLSTGKWAGGALAAGIFGWVAKGAFLGPKLVLVSTKVIRTVTAGPDPEIGKNSALLWASKFAHDQLNGLDRECLGSLSKGSPGVQCAQSAATILRFIIQAESSELGQARHALSDVEQWDGSTVHFVPSARKFFEPDFVSGPLGNIVTGEDDATRVPKRRSQAKAAVWEYACLVSQVRQTAEILERQLETRVTHAEPSIRVTVRNTSNNPSPDFSLSSLIPRIGAAEQTVRVALLDSEDRKLDPQPELARFLPSQEMTFSIGSAAKKVEEATKELEKATKQSGSGELEFDVGWVPSLFEHDRVQFTVAPIAHLKDAESLENACAKKWEALCNPTDKTPRTDPDDPLCDL